MKKILSLCALLVTGVSTFAQIQVISTVNNGLYKPNSTTVRWGGPLLENTTIDLANTYSFNFSSSGNDYFRILNNGNIGIGNSNPAARLSFPNVDASTNASGIGWWNGDPTMYGIYRSAGGWDAPNYQQLNLAWQTGIVLNPGSLYGKSYVDVQGSGLRVTSGKVGIGTTDPSVPLSFGGTLGNCKMALWEGDLNGQKIRYGMGIADHQFRFHVDMPASRFSFFSDEAGSSELMTILGTGNIGIGTNNPQAKLAVKGDICAQKVKVAANGCWADYVFHPSYKLRPLSELEQYIHEQQHLPEIPTASEVEKEGIDLGNNQTLLLKKIEELTLYVIDLNKQVKQQQQEIAELKRRKR